jgi:prophage regulatory protein
MLINKKKLLSMIPLSERTIYNLEKSGKFPKRIALTSRSVAWEIAAVEDWIRKRKESGEGADRPGRTVTVS